MKHFFKAVIVIIILSLNYPYLCFSENDTNYYRKYNDRLIIALYQSNRKYNIVYTQKLMPDPLAKSKINYLANANDVTGVEVDYDKFSLSFAFKSTPPDGQSKQGQTAYKSFNFSFGGNKWLVETSYKNYKGFYDDNTAAYDTSFGPTKPFYQNHSMVTKGLKVKGFYFFNNRKFSYKSSYSCIYRQLKSAFSLFAIGNMYYNRFASDTSFIPPPVWNFYSAYYDMNRLNVLAFSGGMGASGNIIMHKKFFLNLTLGLGIEMQNRNYHYYFSNQYARRVYISLVGDARAALGYNGKNFFITLSSMNDFVNFNDNHFKMESSFISGSFTYGYRFNVKESSLIKKAKETKLYQML